MYLDTALIVPYASMAGASLISMIAMHYPQSQRLLWLPLLALFSYLAFYKLHSVSFDGGLNYLWGMMVLMWFTDIFHALYIEQRRVVVRGEKRAWDFHQAYKMWMDGRRLTTEKAKQRILPNSTRLSRKTFLFHKLVSLATRRVAQILFDRFIFPTPFLPLRQADFGHSKTVLLRRMFMSYGPSLTTRDIALRTCFTFLWAWNAYIIISMAHDVLAIVFVNVLMLDETDEWPILFGKIYRATSLRSFWSKFWHRLASGSYIGIAKIMSRNLKLLGLKPNAQAERFLVGLLVFAFSGLVHAATSAQFGYRRGIWQDVLWFCGNCIAIAVEDAMLSVVSRASKRALDATSLSLDNRLRAQSLLQRSIGTFWMLAFFFWSVPKWCYPKIESGHTAAY